MNLVHYQLDRTSLYSGGTLKTTRQHNELQLHQRQQETDEHINASTILIQNTKMNHSA